MGSTPIIHQLLFILKKKKNYFLKGYNFLQLFISLKNLSFKLKNKKNLLIIFFLFKYYSYTNILRLSIKEIKKIIILLNFKKSQAFFSFISPKANNCELTFSVFSILKLLKMPSKSLKKKNKSLLIVFNFLKKKIFKKLKKNNIQQVLLNIKNIGFTSTILINLLDTLSSFNIETALISKKINFSIQKKKKIRDIKRRLRKKTLKNVKSLQI